MTFIRRSIEQEMFYGAKRETFEKAKILRKSLTYAERCLWKRLRKKKVAGLNFRRQHPIDIYIADFYCHECKLVIEVDGEIHELPENKVKDNSRTAELEKLGIKLIRFTNHEIIHDLDKVIERIKMEI